MSLQSSPEPGTGTGTGTATGTTERNEPVYRSYGCGGGTLGGHLRVNLVVLAVLVGVWALTGADYFWPAWAALGMAAAFAFKALVLRRPWQ